MTAAWLATHRTRLTNPITTTRGCGTERKTNGSIDPLMLSALCRFSAKGNAIKVEKRPQMRALFSFYSIRFPIPFLPLSEYDRTPSG